MGDYTGLRCKVIIKPEYRDEFEYLDSDLQYDWDESRIDFLREYGSYNRATFIPRGALSYMPNSWDENVFADGFNRHFDPETGLWSFQCSLKNYENTIQYFFENVLCKVAQEVIHCEYLFESSVRSTFYELVEGKIVESDREGIKYGYDYQESGYGWRD